MGRGPAAPALAEAVVLEWAETGICPVPALARPAKVREMSDESVDPPLAVEDPQG